MLRSEVVHLLAMLQRKDLKERRAIAGLPPDRADIIVAGVTAVDELMAFFDTNLLKINERGIREGLILKGLKNHQLISPERQTRSWRDAVLDYGRSCHHDEGHALQVAGLALRIFAAIADPFKLGEKERQLLEAAALLHDVGYFIGYSGHHKHTYHLVRHADLFGFTPREREIIAHVARYHRKALPKKKHEMFSRLAPQDQVLVKRLGGILRLADGLDRRRNSVVTGLDCHLFPSLFMVGVKGSGDFSVELFGGKAKGDLFERAFGRKLVLMESIERLPGEE
jgi:exopolyphosphatase/guanosine-5'-triphosphate,3'-diphosphate pyrophosphatase